jgi:phosphoenolpyruvate carboxykinase (ATP)
MAPSRSTPDIEIGPHLHGVRPGKVHAQLSPAALVEAALVRGEGHLSDRGALVVTTGPRTGRSPRDRFIVDEPSCHDEIAWGSVNHPLDPATFDRVHAKIRDYFQDRELFVQHASACADPRHRLRVRVVTDLAWHALFARCLFRPPEPPEGAVPEGPELTILVAGGLALDPKGDGTRSDACIALHLARRLVLIAGTRYAGEIKKSVFSYLNYVLPGLGVFPMHCSANISPDGKTALFFGLSGTGKTTLSADPDRRLIGDDEHGWSDAGVFNMEGGCYAKTIRLSHTGEPQIWNALRFGSVLENVVLDPASHEPDFDDGRLTENTRAAYPLDHIEGAEFSSRGGHPGTILFLTCDASGVLPPLSRLTPAQAQYQFLSGYTAKVAGTEAGVTDPEATFSTCFAAPFLPLPPGRYAAMLEHKVREHDSEVWLVNTGWTGGPFGKGRRIALAHTRAMVKAVLGGALREASFAPDPHFGLMIPAGCPGVPGEILRPRETWPDAEAYDARARQLAGLFRQNFERYATQVTEEVRQAGPKS